MQPFPPTVVLRHRKENLKKCSLRGLEIRSDFRFYTYPQATLPSLDGYILLTLDAPVLTPQDAARGLFVIDATWRYAKTMYDHLNQKDRMVLRSLPPSARTAYPRNQEGCSDPDRGLASIEAIFLAYVILGRNPTGLLDNYYWKDQFLLKNCNLLDFYDYKCNNIF